MKWVDFVKRYADENNLSYKKALSAASGPFKTHKKKQKYTEPKLRKSKGRDKHGLPSWREAQAVRLRQKDTKDDGGCHIIEKISMKKRLSSKVKQQCGICEKRKRMTPPKTRKTKLGYGSSKRRAEKRAVRKPKSKQ